MSSTTTKTLGYSHSQEKMYIPLSILSFKYNFIDDLKKFKSNISLYDLLALNQLKILKVIKNTIKNNEPNDSSNKVSHDVNPLVNGPINDDVCLIGQWYTYDTPSFLLTFEIDNKNVHNFMVELGASTNATCLVV